jgi:hypothetical protein
VCVGGGEVPNRLREGCLEPSYLDDENLKNLNGSVAAKSLC